MPLPLMAAGASVMGAIEAASNIANVIQVGIMVKDSLTPTLETYEGKIETLEQATVSWQNSFIRDIPLNGLEYLKTATDYIKDGIWEAAQLQTSMIASSSDLAQNMKIPIKDAMDMMMQSQITISKLAAALPGETSGYATVYRSLAGTLSKQFKGEAFTAAAEEMTKRVGLLSAIRGSDASQAGLATNRLLAGTMGVGEALTNDIFQQNPALVSALFENIRKMNLDPGDWKTISQEARTKILQMALAKAAPDALISEFEGTFQGSVEGLKTTLFDPISGILGMLRTVDGTGNQTLLSAATGLLDKLLGFKDAVVKLALSFGVNLDPFYYLIKLADWTKGLVAALTSAVDGKDVLTGVDAFLSLLPDMVMEVTVKFVRGASDVLLRLVQSIDFSKVGSIVTRVMNMFDLLKLELLQSGAINKIIEAYVQVQDGIERAKGAIFWSQVWMLVPRFQNWLSEITIGLEVWARGMFEGFIRLIELLAGMLRKILNPFEGVFDGVMGVSESDKAKKAINGAFVAEGRGGSTELVTPNVAPAGSKDKGTFSPQVTINTGGQADPNAIAQQVMTALDSQYSKYREEKL